MHKLASRALAAGIALALAHTAQAQVVISQVYGGAGTATTGYSADFIELHNNGNAPVNLAGWSVQYAQSGSAWQRTALNGSIPAGGYYLIRQASGAGNQTLPPANAGGSIAMAPGLGKVALVANNLTLGSACPTGLVDFVGYGPADCAEGAAPAAPGSNVNAQLRKNNGCTDTQVNAADFTVTAARPRNLASPVLLCSAWVAPRLSAFVDDIVEGDSGYTDALVRIRLDRPAGPDGVSWSVFSNGGSASPASDYLPINKTGFIAPGQSEASFVLQIKGDTVAENDETVNLQIKIANGAVTANGDYLDLIATIRDNDRTPLPPPVLSVAPVARAEGQQGLTPFEFELRLDRPAGPGGVAWSATSVAGGSANPVEDYAAIDLNGVIAEGQLTGKFVLPVQGDLRYEGDEIVKLKVKAVSGAFTATGTELDTHAVIVDDDLRITPIHEVQGRGPVSPLRDQLAIVEGIVTAVVKDGFFLQSEASQADADPETSEGLFVLTGSAPSPQLRAQRVRVAGTVMELMSPGDNPQRESMTAIGGSPLVTQLSSAPVVLPAPASQLLPNYYVGVLGYERYEGMRVTLASTRAVGPTGGVTDAATGQTASDGRFYVLDGPAGQAAPAREPGTRYPVYAQGQFQGWLPRWDGNPEVIGVDSAAAGRAPIEIAAGTPIGGLVGPIDHRSGRYSIVLEPDAPVSLPPQSPLTPGSLNPAAPDPRATTVAHYDLGDLFDSVSPPGSGQPAPMPFVVEQRLGKLSRGIREHLRLPDVVAVSGIDNEALLQRLANRIDSDAVAAGQASAQYRAIAPPGLAPAATGLGFLVRSDAIANVGARVMVDHIEQLGLQAIVPAPGGGSLPLFDQPPLLIDTTRRYPDGSQFQARLVAVRLQSLAGLDLDSPQAERLRERRRDQARFLAQWAQQHQQSAQARPLLLLGDFRAHAFNDGLVDPIGTLIGKPSDPLLTLVGQDGADLVDPDLIDLTALGAETQRYSSIEQGSRQELQHLLADEALLMQTEAIEVERVRINADFPALMRNDGASAVRGGDTDPVHLRLVPRDRAALRLWANRSAPTHRVGESMVPTFTAQVQNLGPEVARRVGLGLALSEPVEPLWVSVHSPNWTCEAPVIADGRTSVACTGENVSPQGPTANAVSLGFLATPERAGRAITMAASVTSSAIDPDPSDNTAQTSIEILPALPAPQP